MVSKSVYLMIKVTVHLDKVREFNEFWGRESLPVWLKHGAKHIGSFTQRAGGPINEIIRLFEFESLSQWEQMEDFLVETEEGRALAGKLDQGFVISLEKKLLRSVY